MKIAVTGANGFVGRHVLAELARREGVSVVASSRSAECTAALPAFIRYVPLDMESLSGNIYDKLGRPDLLMHMAWSGLPNYRSLSHFENELPRQYHFLRTLVEEGLPALLVTGTCYEYGLASGQLSEDQTSAPANPYGFAKAALFEQLRFLQAQRSFSLTWARLFYMYGEDQAPTSLYPLLRAAVMRGDAAFPMSSGEQLRDYLPVQEVARLLTELALRCPDAGPVNVCSGTPISVRCLVEQFIVRHNWSIAFDRGKYAVPDYEPLAFWGSVEKLDRLL